MFFRDMLRNARAVAYQDAEASQQIFFAIERLGMFLAKKIMSLGDYKSYIEEIAKSSSLFYDIPHQHRDWHIPFTELYVLMKNARNDALHVGAYARHITSHAIQLSLIMEDALMSEANKVSDFMVRDVTQTYEWQPISFVRQQMLTNSFSFMPILIEKEKPEWYLLSDYSIAHYLRESNSNNERKRRLAKTVGECLEEKKLVVDKAICELAETDIKKAVSNFNGKPILVVEKNYPNRLIGIIAAFDVL